MLSTLLVSCFICVKAIEADTDNRPPNKAIIVNSTVTLKCEHSGGANSTVEWKFSAFGANTDKTVNKNSKLSHNADRWSVKELDGISELTITKANSEDAGIYICLTTEGQYEAQLMILASDPSCQITMTGNKNADVQYLREKDVVSMWCSVQFWGNWSPKMQWQVMGNPIEMPDTITQSQNNTLKSALNLVINSTRFRQPTIQFSCRTYFPSDGKPKRTTATNNPDYEYIWSAPIFVIKSEIEARTSDNPHENHSAVIFPLLAGILGLLVILLIVGFIVWKVTVTRRSSQAPQHQGQLDERHVETQQDGLNKLSLNYSRNQNMELISAYVEPKNLVDVGLLPTKNNAISNSISNFNDSMPCYAQVHKTKAPSVAAFEMEAVDQPVSLKIADPLYSEINDTNTTKKNSDKTTSDGSTKQKKVHIGADGTVYEGMLGDRKINNVKLGYSKQNGHSLYADVDHTLTPPAPPPRNYS